MKLLKATGPNLSVEITIRDNGSSLLFSCPDASPLEIRSSLRRDQLNELRRNLRDTLTLFAKIANKATRQSEPEKWRTLSEAMRVLRAGGQDLGYAIFSSADVPRVQEFCRAACRWGSRTPTTPKVELIVSELAMAPLEFVPLFRRASSRPIRDALTFQEEARSYLGFNAILKRTVRESPVQQTAINGFPRLRAAVLHFAGLRAVNEVLPALAEGGVSTAEPIPADLMAPDELEARVCGSLLRDRHQILYLGCHAVTTDPSSTQHEIVLAHEPTAAPHHLKLGAINRYFYENGPRAKVGPLVFMNACGGAAVIPTGVTSFPLFFMKENFSGYIGTETIIPDRTAAALAKQFFKHFLDGRTLGESLLLARRHLLDRGDPLGILYTAYAASDMLVRRTK